MGKQHPQPCGLGATDTDQHCNILQQRTTAEGQDAVFFTPVVGPEQDLSTLADVVCSWTGPNREGEVQRIETIRADKFG